MLYEPNATASLAETSPIGNAAPRIQPARDHAWHFPRFEIAGDSALLLDFAAGTESSADAQALARVLALDRALMRFPPPGFIEAIPAYASLLVAYDPAVIDADAMATAIARLLTEPDRTPVSRRRWRVPVAYGGAHGADLEHVAERLATTPEHVIAAHAGARYTVAMLGFLPGFAYLAGLPEALAVPRRSTPRQRVAAGGIAIGGAQTAIGSIEGPSGWHQIGRTPVRTFDCRREPVTFLETGDEIEIVPIDAVQFAELEASADSGHLIAERLA